MKTILILVLAIAALASTVKAQSVTNNGVDLVWSQATEDAIRIAYKIDENLRTNGIAPYTNVVAAVNYKTFVGELLSAKANADSYNIMTQNEARFLATFRGLALTNASAYNKIYRIAFNKGSQ